MGFWESHRDEAVEPVDGMEFSDGLLACPCGELVRLWFNGGELDRSECPKCGTIYRTEHQSIVLRIGEDPRYL